MPEEARPPLSIGCNLSELFSASELLSRFGSIGFMTWNAACKSWSLARGVLGSEGRYRQVSELIDLCQHPSVNVFKRFEFRDRNMFIDLVDAGARRSQFHHLRTDLRNEAAVAGATGRGKFRIDSAFLSHRIADHIDQITAGCRAREKRHAADNPLNVVLQAVTIE